VKDDLEQEIAKLLGEFVCVVRIECLEDFVSLLNQVGAKRFVCLLAIPGAAVGRAEARLERDESFEEAACAFRSATGFSTGGRRPSPKFLAGSPARTRFRVAWQGEKDFSVQASLYGAARGLTSPPSGGGQGHATQICRRVLE
jgi:hypothetical protein